MQIIKALIVDDEILNVKSLQIDLAAHCPNVQVIGVANDADTALESILQLKPNLVFLDVQLHNKTAFDILPFIDTSIVQIVLITAYSNFGIQAVKQGVVDYLLKPINISELIQAVNKVQLRLQPSAKFHLLDKEFIQIPFKGHVELIKYNNIIHLEASGTYTQIFLADNKKILTSKSLHNLEALLPTTDFLRIHHSYIINIHAIEKIIRSKYGSLLLKNGIEIPISATKRKHVAQVLGL